MLFGEFPLTFQEAIQTARNLGYSYIWIDSICIIQDDKEDWITESGMMASVYNGADLVIAASVAKGSNDGFLRERAPYLESTVTIRTNLEPVARIYTYRLVAEPCVHRHLNPLSERAWAYQEHVCARRYVGYEYGQLVWDCCQRSDSESGWVNTTATDNRLRVCCFDMLVRNEPTSVTHDLWRNTVRRYSSMDLSFEEDRIVALSAIASRFQSVLNATYFAGLWKEDLIHDLAWHLEERAAPQTYHAPSWSWVSINTEAQTSWKIDHMTKPFVSEAELIDGNVYLSTSNQFGPVQSGYIRLRGLTIVTTLHRTEFLHAPGSPATISSETNSCDSESFGCDPLYLQCMLLCLPESKHAHDVKLDTYLQLVELERGKISVRRVESTEDYCDDDILMELLEGDGVQVWLFILTIQPWKKEYVVIGLVLGPFTPSADTFRRIGVFHWYGNLEDFDAKTWETREVVIY